eukprot:scaffold33355_cov36-Attheya_sp.AAC.9
MVCRKLSELNDMRVNVVVSSGVGNGLFRLLGECELFVCNMGLFGSLVVEKVARRYDKLDMVILLRDSV